MDWDYEFAEQLYRNVADQKIYITNLGKCTQTDAKPLPNQTLKEYLELLEKEIDIIKPKIIITFGNQVSSIILNQPISVSKCRKEYYIKHIHYTDYKVYPIFYPVGQGMRNIDIAINNIIKIMESNHIKSYPIKSKRVHQKFLLLFHLTFTLLQFIITINLGGQRNETGNSIFHCGTL